MIDRRAFDRLTAAQRRLRESAGMSVLAGGRSDDSVGYFVEPTVVECADPADEAFAREYFGPILAVHVYDDARWAQTLAQLESVSPYALTGAVFARERDAIAAGNFYVNDKPTGAVVGQQPFGGGRASGTNDKAGSPLNLLRWLSPRSIKETTVPATDHRYPHMA